MDRRTFTKLIALLSLQSSRSLGAILKNPKIVVIGAGIIGTLIAYELVKKGAKVILIDKAFPASGASGHSFSWINATYPKKPYNYNLLSQLQHYRIALASLQLFLLFLILKTEK